MNCDFIKNTDGWYECKKCGLRVNVNDISNFPTNCKGYKPSFTDKVTHYASAVATHIATGMKTRTDEEVNELLITCQNCEFFNKDKAICNICGCNCNKNANPLLNKLRMESQHCPKGKW